MNHTLISQILGLSNQLIPSGGTTQQVLSKNSNSDYDISWQTISSGGSSGEPLFIGSPAYTITPTNITNWNLAYNWGNPQSFGYLTSETDPIFTASPAYNITSIEISNWNTIYGYGNWTTQGFLTSETDPIFTASPAFGITSTNITDWGIAYTDAHVHNNFGLLQTLITTGTGTNALTDNGTYVPMLTTSTSNTQILYNNSSTITGSSTLVYNLSSDTTTLTNLLATKIELGNTSTYLTKDGSGNLNFTDAISGTKTLAQLISGATNYWTIVSGGINYAGNVGINSPVTLTDTLTVAGTIAATNFDTSYFQYTNNSNLLLGPNAGAQDINSNKLYIANSNTSTPLIYGEFNNALLEFYASTFIGSGYNLNFSNSLVNISNAGVNNLTFQDAVANSGSPVTLTSLINGTYNALKSDFTAYSTVTTITAAEISTWNKASILINTGSSTQYLGEDGNYHSISAGSMINPMTSVGDLIIGGTAGTPVRLAVGTSSQYLTVISGNPHWSNFPLVGRTENSGYFNTTLGYLGLSLSTTGSENISIGYSTLNNNTSGNYNVSIGVGSLTSNTTGSKNTGIGTSSLASCITGNGNVAIGTYAGYYETGYLQFYLNNTLQSNLANDRAYSLLWGTFASSSGTISGQQLTVNGILNVTGSSINLNGTSITGALVSGSLLKASGNSLIPYTTSTVGAFDSSSIFPTSILNQLNYNGIFGASQITVVTNSTSGISYTGSFSNITLTSGYLTGTGLLGIGQTGVYGISGNPSIGGSALYGVSYSQNGYGLFATTAISTPAHIELNGNSGSESVLSNVLELYRTNSTTGSTISGDIINIIDNPTASMSISGNLLSATIGSTIRTKFNPRVVTSGSAVAYMFDTNTLLNTIGDKLFSFRNNGSEEAYIDFSGGYYTQSGFFTGFTPNISGITISQSSIIMRNGGIVLTNINPSTTSTGSSIAYFLNTINNLNTGDKLLSIQNDSVQKLSIDYAGNVNIPTGSTYQINGTPIIGNTSPTVNQTFSGTFDFSNPFFTTYNNYTVSSNISITGSSTKISGSSCVITMTSDGTHTPVFTGSGFYLQTNSSAFSIVAGTKNVISLVCVAGSIYYSISVFSTTPQ